MAFVSTLYAQPKQRTFFDHLQIRQGTLAWAGLRLGMTRAEAEKVLGRAISVREEPDTEVCGSYFSVVQLAGRETSLQWASSGRSADLEQIVVPFTNAEAKLSDRELSRLAQASVTELIPDTENGQPRDPVMEFVLRGNHAAELMIKANPDDRSFYLSVSECID